MKKNFILLFMMTLQIVANAYNAQIDGIYYNFNMSAKTAEVTFMAAWSNELAYTGVVVIPSKVTFQGNTYSVTSIGNSAFDDCSGLISVTIPNTVTSIGDCAFRNCRGLTSITIPNSVTSIGDYAFQYCYSLTYVSIGNSVTSIGNFAFYHCSALTSVLIGSSVTSIGESAFQSCIGLTSITIPTSVISVGNSAFYGCSGLLSVTIGNGVTSIGGGAFYECSGLKSVLIPNSVTTISARAFGKCSGLTSLNIPHSVKTIGIYAFENCSGLTTIIIPNSVTSIGTNAFAYCSGLINIVVESDNPMYDSRNNCNAIIETSSNTLVTGCKNTIIPNNVSFLGTRAFAGCNGMTSVTIPNSVMSIGDFAFDSCSGLTTMSIGKNVMTIRERAFVNCRGLIDVYCYAEDVPETNSYAFWGSNIGFATLYVSGVFVNAYSQAEPWKNFKSIVAIPGTEQYYTLTYIVDGEVYKALEIKEGTSITPEPAPEKEGYTFSGWSEIPESMPAHDVTVTGSFTINKYKLTYIVDGAEYKSYEIEFGVAIIPETAPTKEGNTFSGWTDIPETMPAHNVIVTGTFTVNKYKVTYMVNNVELKKEQLEYGATITPPATDNEGHEIMWNSHPTTMPAYDITIYGSVATGIESISADNESVAIFSIEGKQLSKYQKGLNIVKYPNGQIRKAVVK